MLTDSIGDNKESTQYFPFGGTRQHTGTLRSAYKFTDQELDTETGLYNYDARLYDPLIGRFITADSIIPAPYNPQSLNRYSYVVNNPLINVDPDGRSEFKFTILRGTGIVTYWDDFGNVVYALSANSGRLEGLNNPLLQGEAGTGPILEGTYYIDLSENAAPDKTLSNGIGWGLFGWELEESFLTKQDRNFTTERGGGFYLHQDEYSDGGNKNETGTGGCIGVLSNHNIN